MLCHVRDDRKKQMTIWIALVEKILLKLIRSRIEGPLLRYYLINGDAHGLTERFFSLNKLIIFFYFKARAQRTGKRKLEI